jgi:alkanesulfonate monooxygenase SsuD/methylene tetrahydromethanopterin reductase-like flavin-dependent oxidoreductase (luciferase family)
MCEDANKVALVSPISIWWQVWIFALPAAGEIFVFVTVYEQALLRSPQRMKVRFFLHVCGLARATVDAPKRTTLSLDVVPERQTDRRLRLVPLPQSLVYAFMLFQTALSSALGEIIGRRILHRALALPRFHRSHAL